MAGKFPDLEILELLGHGGLGAVYKARQTKLDRLVALKILPLQAREAAAFASRFAREAQTLAKLQHPNIVTLYEFGECDGLFYFLMEFVDGTDLRKLLQFGHLPPQEALLIVPQICDALQFAHDRGIVHRDIRPENILLSHTGQVKIADFGFARILAHEAAEPRDSSFLAPEQLTAPLEIDHRADIYALGVVFYQILTGELPSGEWVPPSSKVQIDVRLDEIVLRALDQNRELRWPHAGEMKTQILASAPSRRTSAQRRTMIATLALLAIAAVGGWLVAPRFSKRAPAGAPLATAPEDFIPTDDGKIELLAVSKFPATGETWWQPTGLPFTGAAFQVTGPDLKTPPDHFSRVFVFRTHSFRPGARPSFLWRFEKESSVKVAAVPVALSIKGPPAGENYHAFVAHFPTKARWSTVKIGIQDGPWKPTHELDVAQLRKEGKPLSSALFTYPVETSDQTTRFTFSKPGLSEPRRFIAIDAEGKIHPGSATDQTTPSGNFTQSAVTFRQLPLSRIRLIQAESPAYRWETLSGIAIEPASPDLPKLQYLAWDQRQDDGSIISRNKWDLESKPINDRNLFASWGAYTALASAPREINEHRFRFAQESWAVARAANPRSKNASALHLLFEHPLLIDDYARVTLLDLKGNVLPLRDGPSLWFTHSSGGSHSSGQPSRSYNNIGLGLILREETVLPPFVTIRFHYCPEVFEHATGFPPSKNPGFIFREGVTLDGIGETPSGHAFVRLKYQGTAASAPQFRDEIRPTLTHYVATDFSVILDSRYFPETDTRLLTFEFSSRLSDVSRFNISTRPIRTVEYLNVPILPAAP